MAMKQTLARLFLISWCTLAFLSPAIAQQKGPGEIVVNTIDHGIKILEDQALQGADKLKERKNKLWEILTPVFNFEETSKRALGHHWKDRTEKERQKFVSVFTDVLREIYLGKTDSYAGGSFVFVREIVKDGRGKVRTNFITVDQKTVVVDFSMELTDGRWQVYDITIEGVSMVSNYRSQFNTVIAKSSFEELMEKLINKRDEFDKFD